MKETMERRIIKSEAQGEIQLNCTLLENPDARGLCVLFPGKGYTVDKPLLYYSTRLAMQKGYNLLLLSYGEFTLNDTTRHAMKNLIRGVIDEVRAEEAYQGDLVFIAKSVGALFASDTARILEDTPRRSVYLTPIDQMMDNLAGMDFLAFRIENMGKGRLLQSNRCNNISDRLASCGSAGRNNGHTHFCSS